MSDGESILDLHAADFSLHPPRRPDLVVFPETADEVARVLAHANERRIPVVPFGAGSSLEGHVIPVRGGISLDMTRMNQILEISAGDLTASVEAGVTRMQLNREAGKQGLFFPVDPGADATLGGMAATNAAGTTTVRYGKMRAQVLELEAVLADGRMIRTGSRVAKSSAGYDLTGAVHRLGGNTRGDHGAHAAPARDSRAHDRGPRDLPERGRGLRHLVGDRRHGAARQPARAARRPHDPLHQRLQRDGVSRAADALHRGERRRRRRGGARGRAARSAPSRAARRSRSSETPPSGRGSGRRATTPRTR